MGGLTTEISDETTDVLIEAAHFSPVGVAKMARRHRLHSEASYRFERGVDRELPLRASAKAVAMLASLGGGTIVPGCQHAYVDVPPTRVSMAEDYPDRVAGVVYGLDTVTHRLHQIGCATEHDRNTRVLTAISPSWRSDLNDPADLAEEVIRLEGYENVPVRRPRAFAGRGLTTRQRLRRAVGRGLADAGYVEVLAAPFVSAADADALQLPPEDARRQTLALANPLSDDEPLLRTTLLPGLFRVLNRNIGRGFADTALFELGLVYLTRPGGRVVPPQLRVDRAPDFEELAALEAALPDQPLHVSAVLAGDRDLPGWWGQGRHESWADAIEAARRIGEICQVTVDVRADQQAPWHPGRCAAVFVQASDGSQQIEWLAGYAGELHPRVIQAFGLPARTSALELDMSTVMAAAERSGPVQAPELSSYPLATQDVALIVDAAVPAADVEAALRAGAATAGDGTLLEGVRLFDVYTGEQAGQGRKSLAYTLRFRAPDRTLTAAELTEVRDAAVAEASERTGAELRTG
jgi:phenylalanyl-tRNA synthetase beta chain